MKKIILTLCFLIFCLQANEFEFKDEVGFKDNNLSSMYVLIEKYLQINADIAGLLNNENNVSKNLLSDFQKQKEGLLAQLPNALVSQKINKKAQEKLLKSKEQMLMIQQKSLDKPYIYADTTLNLSFLNMNESFYSSLFEIGELLKNSAHSENLISIIDKEIKTLQDLTNINLETYKSKITNLKDLESIQKKEANLHIALSSYTEILSYLRSNANLLESNYLFSLLELQNWIDYINEVVGIKMINVGKIVLSMLVLGFFYSLRKVLSHIVYFLFVQIFYKNNANQTKLIFIKNVKKPVGFLLIAYSISLCFSIVAYPAPMSIKLNNFFHIIYAILSSWLVFRILEGYGVVFIAKLAQKSGKKEVVNLIIKILDFAVVLITLLYILAKLGFNISAIIASLGIGGLAVALAAKDIIANFFASILLLFDNSFNQGDWIEVSGVEGTVVETGLRKTTIRTFDNSLVFLPNSTIMGANIKNWSKRRMGRHVRIYLGVGYDATPDKLQNCVKDLEKLLQNSPLVAHEEDSALKYGDFTTKYRQNLVSINDLEGYKNACYVALSEFGESSINIELYFYTKAIDAKSYREARQSLMFEFMRIVEKNGLSFAFPSRSIYIENLPPLDLSPKA